MTDSKRHKAALTPIKILLAVQPSQVVKKLKSAIVPTTVMAKQNIVHIEDTVRIVKKKNTKSCRKTHIMKWLIVVWIFQFDIYLRTSRQHSRLGLSCDWFCWRGCARRRRVATIGWGRMPLLQPELCTSILGNAPKFKKFILQIKSDAKVISDYLFGNERFVHSAGKILRLRFQSTKETSITKHHCGIQPWSLDFSWYQ